MLAKFTAAVVLFKGSLVIMVVVCEQLTEAACSACHFSP